MFVWPKQHIAPSPSTPPPPQKSSVMDKRVTFQYVWLAKKAHCQKNYNNNVMDKIVTFQYVCLARKAHIQKKCKNNNAMDKIVTLQ